MIETAVFSSDASKDALDHFIGVRGSYPLDERCTRVGYADVGTFNGGDYAWQLVAGTNDAFSSTKTIKVGRRRLKTKYSEDEFENSIFSPAARPLAHSSISGNTPSLPSHQLI